MKYAAKIKWPDVERPVYLAKLENGEMGYTWSITGAATFPTPTIAEHVAIGWSPSLKPFVEGVKVSS